MVTDSPLTHHILLTHHAHSPRTHSHALQTHNLLNTLTMYSLTTCIHITRHYRQLSQWSPHSLTIQPRTEHSHTQQIIVNPTNTRGALTTHSCSHRSLTHPPYIHVFNSHSPSTHEHITRLHTDCHCHSLTTQSHTCTHHSITTQSLNDHGFITHSSYTPPSSLSPPPHTHTHSHSHYKLTSY